MTEEKILAFLNISTRGKHNKFLDKICLGFNIGFTVMVGGVLLLSSFSTMHLALAISFVVLDIILALAVILNKNPATSYIIVCVSLFLVIFKLLAGYVILSNVDLIERGIPRFTWVHLLVILLSFWLSVYLSRILYRNYKLVKKYPLQEARMKIEANYRVPKWLPIAALVSSCPMVFVRLLKDRLTNFGLGMGFGLMLLACVFASALFVPCLFKCIVIIRFKVYHFFNKCS